ncbi:MAG: hypothetical protein K0B06_08635 [Brevefilum sp.]|nr:hypothetical protein [Brevefilum sp.]
MSLSLEWRHRIMAWRQELTQHFIQPLGMIALEAAFTKDQYQAADALTSLAFNPILPGDTWGAKWEYGWFRSALTLPTAASGQMIALMMDVGGEAAVYVDGEYAGAFDKEHKYILITDAGQPGRSYDILLEA